MNVLVFRLVMMTPAVGCYLLSLFIASVATGFSEGNIFLSILMWGSILVLGLISLVISLLAFDSDVSKEPVKIGRR